MDCHNRPVPQVPHSERRGGSVDGLRPHRSLHPVGQEKRGQGPGRRPYATREEAQQKIEASLRADYPDDKRVDALVNEAKDDLHRSISSRK